MSRFTNRQKRINFLRWCYASGTCVKQTDGSTQIIKKEKKSKSLNALLKLQKIDKNSLDNITKKEKESILKWSKTAYIDLHNYHNNKKLETHSKEQIEEIIRQIEKILSKKYNYRGDIFRGLKVFPKEDIAGILKLKKGDSYTLPSYSSWTKNKKVASHFAKTIFKDRYSVLMHVKNTKGHDISKYTHAPREEEILLKKGRSFIVSDIRFGKGNTVYIDFIER